MPTNEKQGNNVVKIPPAVQPVLDRYLQRVDENLPGYLVGFYLHGSLALGRFNERSSDIDFLALVSRPAEQADFPLLASIHQAVKQMAPRWPMEGDYLPYSDLGKLDQQAVAPYPYSDGEFHPAGHHGLNPVTWWMVKNQGIAMRGPAPEELPFQVDWDTLIDWMYGNLNGYWASWTQKPIRIVVLGSDWGVQWAVLGILRQFYTFQEHDIVSKTEAGEYALTHLPERWHGLIQQAIDIREGRLKTRYSLLRAVETVRFLKYVIQQCNTDRPVGR